MVQVVTSLSMIVRLFILRLPILQVRGLFIQLRVDPSSGVVDKSSEKSYDGFGRVMDMGWKKQ